MKKRNLLFGAAATFALGLIAAPTVYAQSPDSITNWQELADCLTSSSSQICNVTQSFTSTALEGGNYPNRIVVGGENTVLNLNGNTITIANPSESEGLIKVEAGKGLTIKGNGGKIVKKTNGLTYSIIQLRGSDNDANPTKLTIESGVTIEGCNPVYIVTSLKGDLATQNKSIINIGGTLINDTETLYEDSALMIDSGIKGGPVINITGELKGLDAGIFQGGGSIITVNGGTITGASAIATKAGTLNLTNATLTANGQYAEGTVVDGRANPTGAGIQIEANKNNPGDIKIIINDGTSITSENGNAIQAYGNMADKIDSVALNGKDIVLKSADNLPVLSVNEQIADNFPAVTVDGQEVNLKEFTTEFATVKSPKPEPSNPTQPEPSNPDVNGDQDDVPNTGVENPQTGDGIITYIVMGTLSLLGLAGITTKRLILNKR